jgi:2-polyprenyl-3-methyl-5-hydroxy-6-metoxy-1,4-benzoquinol methylase
LGVVFPERIIPDETETGVVAVHLARYEFAAGFCAGKDVLDAACGVGYGTAYLAGHGGKVLGVDIDTRTIEYARQRYGGSASRFEAMNVCALDLSDGAFDVVCSFETIEHVQDPGAAVAEAARVLRPEGIYVVSTPHVAETTHSPANPHHHVEFSATDFESLLRDNFHEVDLYGQRRRVTRRHALARRLDILGLRRRLPRLRRAAALVGSPATADVTASDIEIARAGIETATELVAVCRRPRRVM